MPGNLLWAPLYLVVQLCGFLLGRAGWHRGYKWLKKTPSGFRTNVQRKTHTLIHNELLGSPADPCACKLHQSILSEILTTANHQTDIDDIDAFRQKLKPLIEQTLTQYTLTRTASADIANTLLSTAIGALTIKKFTPGGLGIGVVLAGLYAKYSSASHFIFGETLGQIYYTAFPPEPSFTVTLISIALVLAVLAVVAAFSGLFTDPIQYALGIHQKRLNTLIDHLEKDFQHESNTSFHPKDHYIARIMELFDAIKTHVG